MDKYNLEIHPFKPFIHSDTEVLIIGTFPSHRKNRNFEFYYSSSNNIFWEIIGNIYDVKFSLSSESKAIKEREDFCREKKIGLTDMHYKCYRKNEFSSDDCLYNFEFFDLIKYLDKFGNIKSLIFTSRTDAVGALGLFKTYLRTRKEILPQLEKDTHNKVLCGEWRFRDRLIDITVPYSPSPKVLEKGTLKHKDIEEMYYFCLL